VQIQHVRQLGFGYGVRTPRRPAGRPAADARRSTLDARFRMRLVEVISTPAFLAGTTQTTALGGTAGARESNPVRHRPLGAVVAGRVQTRAQHIDGRVSAELGRDRIDRVGEAANEQRARTAPAASTTRRKPPGQRSDNSCGTTGPQRLSDFGPGASPCPTVLPTVECLDYIRWSRGVSPAQRGGAAGLEPMTATLPVQTCMSELMSSHCATDN
jgi:hypothetical protein